MIQKKSFPLKQALSYAFSTYITHFKSFFILSLSMIFIRACILIAVDFVSIGFVTITQPALAALMKVQLGEIFTTRLLLESLTPTLAIAQQPFFHIIACNIFLEMILMAPVLFIYEYLFMRLSMKLYQGHTPSLRELFSFREGTMRTFLKARIIYFTRIIGGLFLLIVPGVYWATKYFFAGFSIVDMIVTSVDEDKVISIELSLFIKWRLYFFLLLIALCSYTGAVLHNFFFVPIFMIAKTYLYFSRKHHLEVERAILQN